MTLDLESDVLANMSFDDLVLKLKDRLDFHVHRHQNKLPGYDADDIRQELMIELWKKMDRIPADIERVDYRFTRYIDTIFVRRIISLHRLLKGSKRDPNASYKDGLNNASLYEYMEDVFGE